MRQFLLATAALALSMPSFASVETNRAFLRGSQPLQYMPKVQSEPGLQPSALSRKAPAAGVATLPIGDMTGYLDAPDQSTWFYTIVYDKEVIDHGSYKEDNIKGYTVTVYNDAFEEVGKIEDTVELAADEVRVAQVEVSAQLTRKFFNTDNNYELMVALSINTKEYVNHTSTRVYSLGGQKEPLMTLPGYYVSAVNSASDKWGEQFWITFLTEEDTQTPDVNGVMNTVDYVFHVYKYAGYQGMGDPVLELRVPVITISGENAVPFLSNVYEGKPWFAVNHMKYCWFNNPYDFTDETPTPGNELIVDLYTLPSAWASAPEKYSTTRIPSNATVDDRYFLYVGAFSYMNDLSFGRYSQDGNPWLIVTKENYISASDSYLYSYDVRPSAAKDQDASAEAKITLADKVASGYFMSDIPGFDPQVMFIRPDGDNFLYDFVSLISGEVEQTLPVIIEGEDATISASTDRVPGGDSYLYVSAATRGYSDSEGNVFNDVAYITRDARIDHIDRLKLGKDIIDAQIYMNGDAFDPYTFNLDDNREYMALVKRSIPGSTASQEELLVVSADPEIGSILNVEPDSDLGALVSVFFANLKSDTPRLIVIFSKEEGFTTKAYNLPLSYFEAGTGTPEDPYQITTAGGLLQIKAFPTAHYVLAADIDARGMSFEPSSFEFAGSLDGRGHTVSNLHLTGRSLFPHLTNNMANSGDLAAVKNITFVNPVFEATDDDQGFLVGEARYATVKDIHIYGADFSGKSGVAGIVGNANLNTVVSGCSVEGTVKAESGLAGGIVGKTRTSATVSACAFRGSVTGETEVGGIVGALESNSGAVVNCHVKAALKAKNTVGGVAGSNRSRSAVRFCHVQGSIEATEAPRWGGGPCAGGILGTLQGSYSGGETGEEPTPQGAVVEGCYVNLTSLTYSGEPAGEGEYTGQNDTMHRIVGRSAVNDEPEIVDYDSDWNPIYGDPAEADKGLVNNYAVATLDKVAAGVADDTTTTEGKSIAASEATVDFFEGLGYKFGTTTDEPWNAASNAGAPRLYFETGMLTINPAKAEVEVGKTLALTISLTGFDAENLDALLESFTFEIADESKLEMTGSELGDDNTIIVTLTGLSEGTTAVTASLDGATATAEVTVRKSSSIDNIGSDVAASISFDGRTVSAPGSAIAVYTVAGAKVAEGFDRVDLGHLANGIYVVSADGAGTLKIAIR